MSPEDKNKIKMLFVSPDTIFMMMLTWGTQKEIHIIYLILVFTVERKIAV